MGYAKLTYTTSVSSSQLLSDIFKVVTGTITSASQLEFCLTASSEVVNTLGQNLIPIVDAPFEKAFREPCSGSAKDKYIIIRSVTGSASNTATGSNALVGGTGANTAGLIMNAASFVVSGASSVIATNQTYFNTNASHLFGSRFGTNTNNDTQIHLSWSDRHLLMYGGVQGNAATMITAVLEFPDNNLTTFNNSAPFIAVRSSMIGTPAVTTNGSPGSDAASLISLTTVNQFRPSYTGPTTVGTYALTTTSGSGTLYPTISTLASSMATSINATNQPASYFVPLWWGEAIAGIPIMNCSTLTNIFVTTSNIGTTGDTVTIGPITYVTLMLGTTMYGGTKYSAIMVPRL